jgi:hypothetical protein
MKAFNAPLFLIILITILQAMDILLTRYGLRIGLTESNPLYMEIVAIPKIVLPTISYFAYVFLSRYLNDPEKAKATLIFNSIWLVVLVLYIIVICRNVYLITMIKNAAK